MEIFSFVTLGLAIGAVTIRSAKTKNLVPAVIGKLFVATFALFLLKVLR